MTAALQPIHDRDWLERQAREHNLMVSIVDTTAETAVLGVMGPKSRDLLSMVCDVDFGNAAFPFATTQFVAIAGCQLRAQRVTYVGELGWELHVPAEDAHSVLDSLFAAGRTMDTRLAGMMAMNSLRLEKSYVSWGHDVSRDDTPLEAGLGFAIAWEKPNGFLGRDALIAQKAEGIRRRLISLVLQDPEPLLWGHEPVICNGVPTGFTLSASYGHSVGGAIAMAYVTNGGLPVTRSWVHEQTWEIEFAGKRHRAFPHWRAPYDPDRLRILA
jgi:4-methylaminobutanoate oxidase (formaldehyde-forming)